MATIFPCATVKHMTANARPAETATMPAVPLTTTGRTNVVAGTRRAAIGPKHDIGVEHGDECVEVALA